MRGIVEASVDEITMLSPEKFYQMERRAAQATGLFTAFFGGLLLRLSGDFLQLPPVRAASFAGQNLPDSETRKAKPEPDSSDEEMDDDTAEECKLSVTHFFETFEMLFV
jgi:hypothetical protein